MADDNVQKAIALKDEGNKAFTAGDFEAAISAFSLVRFHGVQDLSPPLSLIAPARPPPSRPCPL